MPSRFDMPAKPLLWVCTHFPISICLCCCVTASPLLPSICWRKYWVFPRTCHCWVNQRASGPPSERYRDRNRHSCYNYSSCSSPDGQSPPTWGSSANKEPPFCWAAAASWENLARRPPTTPALSMQSQACPKCLCTHCRELLVPPTLWKIS